MLSGFLGVIIALAVFIFFTLVYKVFCLKNRIEHLQAEYEKLEKYTMAKEFLSGQNFVLFKLDLENHTRQMRDFVDMLYYTEDNVPKYGKKLADLVLNAKGNGELYNYFLNLLIQFNLAESNVYDMLKKEYSLADKDVLLCSLIGKGFTAQQIWTIFNTTESAYYVRCSRLRSRLKLSQKQSLASFIDEYKKTNLSGPKSHQK